MQLLSESERGELSRLGEGQRDEWLANVFAVRSAFREDVCPSTSADSAQQGMSLRLLAWLATAPLLTTSNGWCHVVQWQQDQGEEQLCEERAQGEEGRQIRLVQDLRAGPPRSSLQRPSMSGVARSRSSRTGQPHGLQRPWNVDGVQSLQDEIELHASLGRTCSDKKAWSTICRCGKAGGGAAGGGGLQPQASGQGHRFGWSREELPDTTREDPSPEGGVSQGEAGSSPTNRRTYEDSFAPKAPEFINLEEADHSMIPGRKGRKTETAEELEASQREEAEGSPGSFTVVSS